jgi:myo-inositol-1(or 4)-monophosphatase
MRDYRVQDFTLLRDTAQEAAKLALSFWGKPVEKERKSDGSVVTEADKAVDALLSARLRAEKPDYGWLSEESPEHERRLGARRVWIVDPIDGTLAFIQGRDDWTIALSLVEDGAPILAVVINPVRKEIFEASAGGGAFLNGHRIAASNQESLPGARVALAATSSKSAQAPWVQAVPIYANSSIYRLAFVASAKADASIALKPKWEWDVAAGALLVSEAGGKITNPAGAPLFFNSAEAKVEGFLAAAPNLHQMILDHLKSAIEGSPR